ncbi:hypothetical protein Dimus_038736 [Dionaea muscipula]
METNEIPLNQTKRNSPRIPRAAKRSTNNLQAKPSPNPKEQMKNLQRKSPHPSLHPSSSPLSFSQAFLVPFFLINSADKARGKDKGKPPTNRIKTTHKHTYTLNLLT